MSIEWPQTAISAASAESKMRVWPVYGPFGIEISKDMNVSLKWLKILKTTFSETPRSL